MKSKKFIIFGAAAILALVGCSNMAARFDSQEVQRATTQEGNVFTADYTTASFGRTNQSKHTDFSLDSVIKVNLTGGNNTGNFFTNGNNIRLYQNENPTITFSTINENYIINSITLTYTVDKTGILLDEDTQIPSNTTVQVNASTKTFTVGNTNSDVSNGQVRINNFKVVYTQVASEESVSISSPDTKTMVGSQLEFTFVTDGFESDPVLTWNSSEESVATIDSNGVLTPLSMGSTKISATANGSVSSNKIEIFVWPDNTIDINVATAASILEFAGNNDVPYRYGFTGIITAKSGKQLTLKELNSEETIIAYGISNASLTVGTKIHVFGNIQEYNNAPEFAGTIEYYTFHTVTFNPNNGDDSIVLNDIHSGTLLNKPENISKEGYTLDGWYDEEDNQWDFENDTVKGDLVLTAKWLDNQLASVISDLNEIDSYFSLGYKFNSTSNNSEFAFSANHNHTSEATNEYELSEIGEDSTISEGINISSLSKVYAAADNQFKFGSSKAAGSITFTSDETITHVTITARKYGSDSNYLVVNNQSGTTLESSLTDYHFVVPNGGSKTITIATSSKRAYISEIKLFNKSMTISNDEIRIKAATDSFATFNTNHSTITDYGIEVSTSSKRKKYNYADANSEIYSETKQGNDYQFKVISLGAALTNVSRLDEKFTIKPYAVYNDVTYYSENQKAYSIVELVEAYYAKPATKGMIQPLYDVLVYLGKIA